MNQISFLKLKLEKNELFTNTYVLSDYYTVSKLRCPYSKQNHNKIAPKTSLKNKTHKDIANQNQAFAIFLFLF